MAGPAHWLIVTEVAESGAVIATAARTYKRLNFRFMLVSELSGPKGRHRQFGV